MICITSKVAGFRRCGIAHPAMPTEYPDKAFSKSSLAELQAEPMLTVEIVPDEPKGDGKKGGKKGTPEDTADQTGKDE